MTTTQRHIIDMTTNEGRIEHLSTLPTANLRAIVARQTHPQAGVMMEAFLLEATAEAILIQRGEA